MQNSLSSWKVCITWYHQVIKIKNKKDTKMQISLSP